MRVLVDSENQREESSFLDLRGSRYKIRVIIFSSEDVPSEASFAVHL